MGTMDRLFRWVLEQFWGGHGDSEELEPVVQPVPEARVVTEKQEQAPGDVEKQGNVFPVE